MLHYFSDKGSILSKLWLAPRTALAVSCGGTRDMRTRWVGTGRTPIGLGEAMAARRSILRWTTSLLVGSIWLALAGPALAQWPQPEGGGQVIIGGGPYWARINGFDNRGNATRSGSLDRIDISPYWEHGVTQRWTVGIAPRLQAVWMDQTSTRSSGFGLAEAAIFARYAVYRGDRDVLAVQGTVFTPGIGSIRNPFIAEPNASFEARVSYGRGFAMPWNTTGFGAVGLGYRFRAGAPSDEVRFDATVGWRFAPSWSLIGQYFGSVSVRNNSPGGPDFAIHRLQGSVVYDLNARHSVQLGYMREVDGRRVALGQAVLLAWWYRY